MYVFIVKSKIKGLFTNVHDLLLHIQSRRYAYTVQVCFLYLLSTNWHPIGRSLCF